MSYNEFAFWFNNTCNNNNISFENYDFYFLSNFFWFYLSNIILKNTCKNTNIPAAVALEKSIIFVMLFYTNL